MVILDIISYYGSSQSNCIRFTPSKREQQLFVLGMGLVLSSNSNHAIRHFRGTRMHETRVSVLSYDLTLYDAMT